jgi:Flp pilus assembly pilin Flp
MDLTVFRAYITARLNRDERGANLVEYVLLLAFIAIIVFVAVKILGTTVSTKFSEANDSLN